MEMSVRHAVRLSLDTITGGGPCGRCVPSRLEPTIKEFRDPLQLTFSLPRGDGDVVDFVQVQVSDSLYSRQLLKFLDRTDCDDLHMTSILFI